MNEKVATLATKVKLKTEQNKIIKLQGFGSSYFRGNSHFEDASTQNYLLLQLMYKYF